MDPTPYQMTWMRSRWPSQYHPNRFPYLLRLKECDDVLMSGRAMTFFSPRPGHPPGGVGKSLSSSAFRAELYTKTSVGGSSTLQGSLGGLNEHKVSNLGELTPSNSKGLGSKYLQGTPTRKVLYFSPGRLGNSGRRGTWLHAQKGRLG